VGYLDEAVGRIGAQRKKEKKETDRRVKKRAVGLGALGSLLMICGFAISNSQIISKGNNSRLRSVLAAALVGRVHSMIQML
jgi:hypothetical protein